jgi:hypothetical protein
MVVYKCICGEEVDHKKKIVNHIIKYKCIVITNVSDLCINRKRYQKGVLTDEEKKHRIKNQKIGYNIRNGAIGARIGIEYAKYKLMSIKNGSKYRNHNFPTWTPEDILKLLDENKVYKIETEIGMFEFPMKTTNGYHNSASFDRIDDKLGYSEENIEIRPRFLNTAYKLTTFHIKQIPILRKRPRSTDELELIVNLLNYKPFSKNFFYTLAHGAHSRNIISNFDSTKKFAEFLIKQYIEQGGRCYYSNIPINPINGDQFMISIERLDPGGYYDKNNIVLIVVGLNFTPGGQSYNLNISNKQKNTAMSKNIFSQKYWDECTLLTQERKNECEKIKECDRLALLNLYKLV